MRLAGAAHRQERIQHFKNKHLEWYGMLERIAYEKVDNHILFSKESGFLKTRAVESIATRRARFSYLKQHKDKISTLIEPAPVAQQGQNEPEPEPQFEQQPVRKFRPLHQENLEQQSKIQSSSYTLPTRLDMTKLHSTQNNTKNAESVMSIRLSRGIEFPSLPKLINDGASFQCPFCLLECPSKEASSNKQWR